MDHRQSKLESDYRQTDVSELPNSNPNEKEELKELSKDHANPPSAVEDNTTIEENKSAEISKAVTKADREWRQYIERELESMRNAEKAGQDGMENETSSPKSLDHTLAVAVEKIPFEHLIDSAIRYFTNNAKPTPLKKEKGAEKSDKT